MANIAMYFFGGDDFGMGHWYRSVVLMHELISRGNNVLILGNKNPYVSGTVFKRVSFGSADDFTEALDGFDADVIVSDIPFETPSFITEYDARLVSIDGVGCGVGNGIVISQGIDGGHELEAPEYLIIDEKFTSEAHDCEYDWFVFGGYYDKMDLAGRFYNSNLMTEKSFIVSDKIEKEQNVYRQPVDTNSVIGKCEKAVVAMGMVVWELLAKGIKPVVFSLTDRHLKTAMIMHGRGWVTAYNKTGLPKTLSEFNAFLESAEVGRAEPVVNGGGVGRVADIIEEAR